MQSGFYWRAQLYRRKGDIDHAIDDFSRAIVLSPQDRAAHYYRAQLFVAKQTLIMRGHIVFDEIEVAIDLADKIGLVATGVKIAMPDLSIIIGSDRIIALANMYAYMHVVGEIFDHPVDHINGSSNLALSRGGKVRLVDLDMLASRRG